MPVAQGKYGRGAPQRQRAAFVPPGAARPKRGPTIINGKPELLTPKQREANKLLVSEARHVCLVGGSRSGKTAAITRALLLRALTVPSRHAILRFRAVAVWPAVGMDTIPWVLEHFFPDVKYRRYLHDKYFQIDVPGGGTSEIWLGGLDEKDRTEKILGNEYSSLFFNECSEIPYASVLIALSRLAENTRKLKQQAYYDLNPTTLGHWTNVLFGDHKEPVSKRPVLEPGNYRRLFLNPYDNAANLDPEYLKSLDALPERVRARFRDGRYVDETESTLWPIALLEETRVSPEEVPELVRIVVGIDPSGAANELESTHDPIGIVVAGVARNGHAYVLADYTLLAGPLQWGRTAVAAYKKHHADRIVAEQNFGGAMVEFVIRSVDQAVPFKLVVASRGKVQRAEPVAALYAQHRVHHVGRLDDLEDELSNFTDLGFVGMRSPNRADALVWCITELLLGENAEAWVQAYKLQHQSRLAEAAAPFPRVRQQSPQARLPSSVVLLRAAAPHAALYISAPNGTSRTYRADGEGLISAEPAHVEQLKRAGCSLIPPGAP